MEPRLNTKYMYSVVTVKAQISRYL